MNINTKPVILIISGPSGAGKTTMSNALIEAIPDTMIAISHTTRKPRPGEISGEDYFFVSKAEFQDMVNRGEMLEYAEVYDHLYGTSRKSIEKSFSAGKNIILDIDWQGAHQIREAFPGSCLIFIIPPSLESLHDRLTRRGQDSESVIQRRMRDARAEISHWAEFDHLVVNDDFDAALEELLAIINDHRRQRPRKASKNHQYLAERLGKR